MSKPSLEDLIAKALESNEPDPHVLARRLLPRIAEADRDALVLAGLTSRLCERVRFARTSEGSTNVGPSRWAIAKQRVIPGDHWEMLVNCNVDDLLALADKYAIRAAQNATREREYRDLADELSASGCATVGEMWAAKEAAA